MRYFYKKPVICVSAYGETYICDHPVYDRCTLYRIGDKGLAVIQQRYDPNTKHTWWGEIDKELTDVLYLNMGFRSYFEKRSGVCTDGLYPTVTIRQIMWALRIKPLPKERWESSFDHSPI